MPSTGIRTSPSSADDTPLRRHTDRAGRNPWRPRPLLATAIFAVAFAALPLSAGELTYFGSLGYYEGSYEVSVDTQTLFLLNGLRYEEDRWSISASIPVIDQDTPFVSWTGSSPIPSGRRFGTDDSGEDPGPSGSPMGSRSGPNGGRVEVPDPETLDFDETGLGDPLVRFDFDLTETVDRTFGLYISTKIPLADAESGFGTGEWDFGLGLRLLQNVGPGNLLLEVGWWSLGDLPDLELEDPVTGTVAYASKEDGRKLGWQLFVNAWSRVLAGQDGPMQAGFTLSRRMSTSSKALVTLTAGLSDASPDWGLSAGWSVTR